MEAQTAEHTGKTTVQQLREQARLERVLQLEAQAQIHERTLYDLSLQDSTCRTLRFMGALQEESVVNAIMTMGSWARQDRDSDCKRIHLLLNTFTMKVPTNQGYWLQIGGTFEDALAMVDWIRFLRQDGFEIVGEVDGDLDLKGCMVLQSCDRRIVRPHGIIKLEQENWTEYVAQTGEAKERIKFFERLEQHGWGLIAGRTQGGVTLDAMNTNLDHGRNWYIYAKDAERLGLVDEIGSYTQPARSILPAVTQPPALDLKSREYQAASRIHRAQRLNAEREHNATITDGREEGLVPIFGGINPKSIREAQVTMDVYSRQPGKRIRMLINTRGGSVPDGFSLIDRAERLKAAGHEVETNVIGYGASMGIFLLQAASDEQRIIGENAWLLAHEIGSMFGRNNSQQKEQLAHAEALEQVCLPYLVRRSTYSVEQMRTEIDKTDKWFNADEALEKGLADRKR